MLRRPSQFATSASVSQQDLDVRRKGDDERSTTISVVTFQDEISRRKQSSLKEFDRRSEPSVSESSKSIDVKEKLPVGEQIKKDILDYLGNLIEKVEWLALFYVKIDKYYIHFLTVNFFLLY